MAGTYRKTTAAFHECLAAFRGPGDLPTLVKTPPGLSGIRQYTGEFWTSRQRQASSLHEISYRACFKPQLPRFFISLLTRPGETVYDPFSGRGTTAVEAGLCGRNVIANDANPLSRLLTEPRFFPPTLPEIAARLETIPRDGGSADRDLSMFYHPATEQEIVALREYLIARNEAGTADSADAWIRMVATNRLTGHSTGFFSVYTLPPNQAVSPESQRRINKKRDQVPEYRDTHALILKKSKSLLARLTPSAKARLARTGKSARFLTGDARDTPAIEAGTVQLTVTSPPFLDIVQYREDNWLRCWFCGLDEESIGKTITMARTVAEWKAVMGAVFSELSRITAPGGWVAFEVGEVRKKTVRLEEHVVPLGQDAGFSCECVIINQQVFSKTSHIWGVGNNECGTNTNRIVVFSKPDSCR